MKSWLGSAGWYSAGIPDVYRATREGRVSSIQITVCSGIIVRPFMTERLDGIHGVLRKARVLLLRISCHLFDCILTVSSFGMNQYSPRIVSEDSPLDDEATQRHDREYVEGVQSTEAGFLGHA